MNPAEVIHHHAGPLLASKKKNLENKREGKKPKKGEYLKDHPFARSH